MRENRKCLVCHSAVSDTKALEQHFASHDLSEVRRFHCHLCDLKFVKFSTLSRHQLRVHLNKTNKNLRLQSWKELKDLRSEAKVLLEQSRQNLDENEEETTRHSNIEEEDSSSANCEESMATDPIKKQKKSYKCLVDGCMKTFQHLTSLIMHGRCVHSDERTFTCEICSKSFKTSSNLNVHIKMHKNQRDHPCNMCTQSFFTSSHLKAHIRVHLNMTNYECADPECGKTFIHLSSYKKHLNFHKGIKSHHCTVCERKFSQLCHLREHLKIHSNERSHICAICNKAFRRPDTLRIHQRRHES
jgi:uncharacterized Zn-finger protein